MIVICLCYLQRMRISSTFWVLLSMLVALGGWGLSRLLSISDFLKPSSGTSSLETNVKTVSTTSLKKPELVSLTAPEYRQEESSSFARIVELIENNNTLLAANLINEHHSYLSIIELKKLKQGFLTLAFSQHEKTAQQKNTLLMASGVFDELDVWVLLANSAVNDQDWPLAHKANIKASQLENDPIKLEQHFERLLYSASKLRSSFENINDELSIKKLYQELSNLHPVYQRFQIELAFSHLRLNDIQMAKTLLTNLRYDIEYGTIAQRTLDKINAQIKEQQTTNIIPTKTIAERNQIVIPLITSGSSFLIDVDINRKKTRLLLDTGASITALSSSLISKLQLQETGQIIRISTANGINDAKLYRAKRLALGRLELRDMIIAEINLAPNNRFQGLLGTDALNQLKPEYSYRIDNLENALIFRKH